MITMFPDGDSGTPVNRKEIGGRAYHEYSVDHCDCFRHCGDGDPRVQRRQGIKETDGDSQYGNGTQKEIPFFRGDGAMFWTEGENLEKARNFTGEVNNAIRQASGR